MTLNDVDHRHQPRAGHDRRILSGDGDRHGTAINQMNETYLLVAGTAFSAVAVVIEGHWIPRLDRKIRAHEDDATRLHEATERCVPLVRFTEVSDDVWSAAETVSSPDNARYAALNRRDALDAHLRGINQVSNALRALCVLFGDAATGDYSPGRPGLRVEASPVRFTKPTDDTASIIAESRQMRGHAVSRAWKTMDALRNRCDSLRTVILRIALKRKEARDRLALGALAMLVIGVVAVAASQVLANTAGSKPGLSESLPETPRAETTSIPSGLPGEPPLRYGPLPGNDR